MNAGQRDGPSPIGRAWWKIRAPWDLWFLAGMTFWLLAVGYGLRDPWPADEPRFAMIGRDIVESGNWLVPHRGPELYAEKPPVFLWMQALAYLLTGRTRTAFLLPSLLAGVGVLVLTWDLLRRVHGRTIAFMGAAALLFTVQFTLQARTAQIDMVLTFFTTLGLYGILRHLVLGPAWGWYVLAGIATGMGVITKGTGFLPWLVLLPYAFARWSGMKGLSAIPGGWRWLTGPIAMLVPVLLWAIPLMLLAAQPGHEELAAYRDDLFFRQTVTRYTRTWTHLEPFWYFVVNVIPALWMPLSLFLPWAVPAWARRIRRGHAIPLLLLGWVLLVVVFFSLSPGKRGVYILPALPGFALALAPLLPGLLRRALVQRVFRWVALVIALVLVLVPLWTVVGNPGFEIKVLQQNQVAPWTWLLVTGVGALVALTLTWRRGDIAFAAVVAVVWSGYGLLGFSNLDGARSARDLMQQVHELTPSDVIVGIVDAPEQMLFQAVGEVKAFGFRTPIEERWRQAEQWLASSDSHWLLLQWRKGETRFELKQAIEVGVSNRRTWYLVKKNALLLHSDKDRLGE